MVLAEPTADGNSPVTRPVPGGEVNPGRPASHAGLLAQPSTGRSARFWTGPPPGRSRRSRISPVVPVQSRGHGPAAGPRATAGADWQDRGRPGDPRHLRAVRQPGGAGRGTFSSYRHPVPGPVMLARDAGPATASRGGRLRPGGCGEGLGRVPAADPVTPGGHRDAAPPTGVRGVAVTGRRPGLPVPSTRRAVTEPGDQAARGLAAGPCGQLFTVPSGRTAPG
jgi:hypothetical protein